MRVVQAKEGPPEKMNPGVLSTIHTPAGYLIVHKAVLVSANINLIKRENVLSRTTFLEANHG